MVQRMNRCFACAVSFAQVMYLKNFHNDYLPFTFRQIILLLTYNQVNPALLICKIEKI